MNATVDIGNNLTSLLERLAQQIGTTADKVFPWYVHQAYLEGVTELCALMMFLTAAIVALVVSLRRADFNDGPNGYAVASMVAGVGLFLSVISVAADGADSVRKILNPNYYAMTMLTRDVGRLVK